MDLIKVIKNYSEKYMGKYNRLFHLISLTDHWIFKQKLKCSLWFIAYVNLKYMKMWHKNQERRN